jgi:hypothetical protein
MCLDGKRMNHIDEWITNNLDMMEMTYKLIQMRIWSHGMDCDHLVFAFA